MPSHNEITYRESVPQQEPFFKLFETTGWNQGYGFEAGELHEAIKNSWYLVAAYDGDVLVGFGRVISDGVYHAFIVEMIIAPEYQGKGIGTAIMNQLVGKCRENRFPNVQLFCAKGKQEFYKRFGFEVRQDDAPGMQLNFPKARP
ncbi:MAG: family N-acetyltransferase [Chloroflexi bacterium]|nr:family N-acetyltransferase [Chloroflexota bacterium]